MGKVWTIDHKQEQENPKFRSYLRSFILKSDRQDCGRFSFVGIPHYFWGKINYIFIDCEGRIVQLEFQRNLGVKDRVIRIVIGLILVSLVMMRIATNWMIPSALYIAGVLILEATVGY